MEAAARQVEANDPAAAVALRAQCSPEACAMRAYLEHPARERLQHLLEMTRWFAAFPAMAGELLPSWPVEDLRDLIWLKEQLDNGRPGSN